MGAPAVEFDPHLEPGSTKPLRIGVSACLLGHEVRFDRSHKRDRFLTDLLGVFADWVPVCPEVGAGMPVPRPTLRLVGERDDATPRLHVGRSGEDRTRAVTEYAERVIERIAALSLSGFVLKSRSPTCGMERVRVYAANGMPSKHGVGVFARVLLERCPELPVEEEGRLQDPALRESFLDAVFARARWHAFLAAGSTPRALIDFHRRNKFLLRVHSPAHAMELGQLVAQTGCRGTDIDILAERYGVLFMEAIKQRPTQRRQVALLRRIADFLKPRLSAGGMALLLETIDDYAANLGPRHTALTLIRHHAQEHGLTYLLEQSYLDPYPKALGRS
ncbi:YbgA family protein [Haliangium ochraceum]|uniref:DUF1722 domain-containing protein n=1 Tax=Haliangium ochraceum (strain DSM 14365 / JCM 11303 / SMP-2) TaxID=502025 RepID=D0LNP3_HALO1|nr:DUF523 and DUF1722 domain-containing protein [Haliangium ochraceum]ACY16948.1 protein of unknown function DUF523 [Haliangium ochraceum DSM 14365]